MTEHTFIKRKYAPTAKEFIEYLCENPHKNLPVIVEVTDDFYVMEYIDGKTLQSIVDEEKLAGDEAKKLILQLLDAVEVLHKFKIVHRDIKPENIIITDEGILKLIDFDIARKIVPDKKHDTHILGTAGYAAPEQFGFTQTDEKSDIYAIGIVYNFMLTGKFPTEEKPGGQIKKIVEKCIRINKDERYKSISQLRRDIQSERFTSYRLWDIIPGFRTRNVLKMLFAMSAYILVLFGFIVISAEEAPETGIFEIVMFGVVVLCYLICDFFFFAIATNFLNILDKIKLSVKRQWLKKLILLVIIYVTASVISYAVSEGNMMHFVLGNPINATVGMYLYMIYSIISPLILGML